MRRFMAFILGVFVLLCVLCTDNPYSPENIVTDVNVRYSVSQLNDTVNAYCFYPITFKAMIESGQEKYIDSMFLRKSGAEPFVKFNRSFEMELSYATEGDHEVTVRIYYMSDGGKYRDSLFIVKTAIGYSAGVINANLNDTGSYVVLRGVGYKANDIMWEWDLRRVGGSVVQCFDDTAVFIRRAVDDTVFLAQVDSYGNKSTYIPVPFKAGHYVTTVVSFAVSGFSIAGYNSLCFFPVTFTANPIPSDRAFIDRIELFMTSNPNEASATLFTHGSLTTSFVFADTGSHRCIMRVYEVRAGVETYSDSVFYVKIGKNYGGEPVDVVLEGSKSAVDLIAVGDIADGVYWEWDLSRIGLENEKTQDKQISILLEREFDDTIFVSQVDVDGNRSPWVAVPFKSKFYRLGLVPYTLSRVSSTYNGFCFTPVSLGVHPLDKDKEFIDSMVVFIENDLGMQALKLGEDNNYLVMFDFADTGLYEGRLVVYDNRLAMPENIKFEVKIGVGHRVVDGISVELDYFGSNGSLVAGGVREDGVDWRWVLPGAQAIDTKDDRVSINIPGVAYNLADGLKLYMVKKETVDGNVRERVSTSATGLFNVRLKQYQIKVTYVGGGNEVEENWSDISKIVELESGRNTNTDLTKGFMVNSGETVKLFINYANEPNFIESHLGYPYINRKLPDPFDEEMYQILNDNNNTKQREVTLRDVLEDKNVVIFVRKPIKVRGEFLFPPEVSIDEGGSGYETSYEIVSLSSFDSSGNDRFDVRMPGYATAFRTPAPCEFGRYSLFFTMEKVKNLRIGSVSVNYVDVTDAAFMREFGDSGDSLFIEVNGATVEQLVGGFDYQNSYIYNIVFYDDVKINYESWIDVLPGISFLGEGYGLWVLSFHEGIRGGTDCDQYVDYLRSLKCKFYGSEFCRY